MLKGGGMSVRGLRPAQVAAAGVASVMVVGAGLVAVATPAASEMTPKCGLTCGDDNDGGSEGSAEDGYVNIHVWGSGTTAGEDGFEIPGETVYKLPPCHYTRWLSGSDAYQWFLDNRVGPDNHPVETDRFPDFEDYKDDEDGYWWTGQCLSELFDSELFGSFTDYVQEWFEEHQPLYVEPGDPLPVPEIPPEVLVEYAYDAMELPEPEVDWNPQRQGDGATLVNFETWFWLDDGPVQLEVHAEAGNNSATVEATLGEMGFSAPSADPVTCTGFGTAWSPGSQSECFLQFTRSSASMPGQVTPVYAQSHWDIEWFANGEPQGPLDPQTTEQEFQVPVAESQARVTN
jgi:hypothetical protein